MFLCLYPLWTRNCATRSRQQNKLEARSIMDMPEELLQAVPDINAFVNSMTDCDVETGGFDAQSNALLEVAAVLLEMDSTGKLQIKDSYTKNIEPFEGAVLGNQHLSLLLISMTLIAKPRRSLRHCEISLDPFIKLPKLAAPERLWLPAMRILISGLLMRLWREIRSSAIPFIHSLASILQAAGLAYGQTVLAKACQAAEIEFDNQDAHSALYDATKTAELFCAIVNKWKALGGWS